MCIPLSVHANVELFLLRAVPEDTVSELVPRDLRLPYALPQGIQIIQHDSLQFVRHCTRSLASSNLHESIVSYGLPPQRPLEP